MSTATISIEVDEDSAKAYSQASDEHRRKLQLLLNLRLRELTTGSVRPLREVMDAMGKKAAEQGLTPELLESLLHDK
jgi:hypothetical protein